MVNELKFSLVQQITAPALFPASNIANENKIRFVIEGATGSNIVVVRARIVGQADWDTVATITGNSKTVVNVSTYDELQVECTVYASSTNNVKVIASSFNEASGSTTIDAPTGGSVSSDEIIFTSSDDSVIITANPLTNTIDFVSVGSGEAVPKYVATVQISDWVGPSAGEYSLTIPFTFHAKTNPVVTCMEESGADFEVVDAAIFITGNDVKILVLSTPDTRFAGKIFIE